MPTVPDKYQDRVPMTPNQTVNEDFKTMAFGLMRRSQEVEDFTGWKGYLDDVMPQESKPQGELAGTKLAKDLGEDAITSGKTEAMGMMRPGAEASAGGKPQFFANAGDNRKTAEQFPYTPGQKTPQIDHEDALDERGQNFEGMYKQLDDLRDKVKPGNLLRMHDKKGNDYYFQRDDDYEHGYSYYPKPPPETSSLGTKNKVAGGSEDIWRSIYQQESSSGKDTRTSSTGAIGPGQIMPGTWKEWAKPGENIRNTNDNIAVSKRIVESYHQKYGGDPARVAVAYFSGPGNVAPAGSPTPWKRNSSDGAVSVSQYVQQVVGRMGGNVDVTGVPKAASSEGSGWEKKKTTGFGGGSEDQRPFKPDTSWLDAIVNQRRRKKAA